MNCRNCQAPQTGNSLVCEYCGVSVHGQIATQDEQRAVNDLLLALQKVSADAGGYDSAGVSRKEQAIKAFLMGMWTPSTADASARLATALLAYASHAEYGAVASSKVRAAVLQLATQAPGDPRVSLLTSELERAEQKSDQRSERKEAIEDRDRDRRWGMAKWALLILVLLTPCIIFAYVFYQRSNSVIKTRINEADGTMNTMTGTAE